jgi:hypothetical protein
MNGELSMAVPCSGLALDATNGFFYSLLCTNKHLAKFALTPEEDAGGKLEAVASISSQHGLALHSMQYRPEGFLVLLGKKTLKQP